MPRDSAPGGSGRRRLAFAAATLLGPPLLLLAVLEGALRLLLPAPPPPEATADRLRESAALEVDVVAGTSLMGLVAPSAVPGLVYELKPRRRWVFRGVEVATNGLGCRDDEVGPRAEGVRRVLGVGDSVMWGWGVPAADTYMERLQRGLGADLGRPVEVVNCGVPGYNTAQQAAFVRARGAAIAPDLLLVGYVLNDTDPPNFAPPPPRPWLHGRSRLFELGADVLRERLGVGARRREGTLEMARAMGEIAGWARARGIPALVFVYPQDLPAYDAEAPRRAASAHGLRLVDLAGPFAAHYRAQGLAGLGDLSLGPHDAHPNRAGHALLAETLRPEVAALLR